jgi:hypothetical protein
MGANLLIFAGSLLLPLSQHDTTDHSERPSHGFGYERLSDALAYNRVQGLSVGLGYRITLPGTSSTGMATIRYGLSDERVTGRLSIVRELRRGYVRLSGYSDVADVDPMSQGRTISNTLNALFAGHDNADYSLSRGASLTWETPLAPALTLELSAGLDRRSSITRTARSAVNDFLGGTGVFPANPPIREGTFGSTSVRLRRPGRGGWMVTLDAIGGAGTTIGRLYGGLRRSIGRRPMLGLHLKAGTATEPGLPQTLFRLGGLNTVRGFEYGTRQGPAFWSVQAELTLLPGRIRPVLFADAGQAGRTVDLFSSTALLGGGAGLELLRGLIRLDLSRPISPHAAGKLRFDLVLREIW